MANLILGPEVEEEDLAPTSDETSPGTDPRPSASHTYRAYASSFDDRTGQASLEGRPSATCPCMLATLLPYPCNKAQSLTPL